MRVSFHRRRSSGGGPLPVRVFPDPWSGEALSFIDFHESGFGIPASDFPRGFLHEYGVQLQHIPPNGLLQLAGFVVIYEAFFGIKPNKDLFRWLFEVMAKRCRASAIERSPLWAE
jgi:hypothetical protein